MHELILYAMLCCLEKFKTTSLVPTFTLNLVEEHQNFQKIKGNMHFDFIDKYESNHNND